MKKLKSEDENNAAILSALIVSIIIFIIIVVGIISDCNHDSVFYYGGLYETFDYFNISHDNYDLLYESVNEDCKERCGDKYLYVDIRCQQFHCICTKW